MVVAEEALKPLEEPAGLAEAEMVTSIKLIVGLAVPLILAVEAEEAILLTALQTAAAQAS